MAIRINLSDFLFVDLNFTKLDVTPAQVTLADSAKVIEGQFKAPR